MSETASEFPDLQPEAAPAVDDAYEAGDDEPFADDEFDDFADDDETEPELGWPEQPAGQQAPAQLTQEQFAEQLEDLALEDPVAAVDLLATMRAAQFAQQQQATQDRRLAPIYERLNQEEAAKSIAGLEQKFGSEAIESAKHELVERVSADEAYYLDPATRDARLQQTLAAILYEQQVAYDRGDDVRDSVSALSSGRDLFGSIRPEYSHPEANETRPQYERRLAETYRASQRAGRHPDPEVAAIDAAPSRRLPR